MTAGGSASAVATDAPIGAESSRPVPVHLVRPRPAGTEELAEAVQRLLALADLTPTVVDALERLGHEITCEPAHGMTPLRDGARVCGPAVTLKYLTQSSAPGRSRSTGAPPRLGDRAAVATALPGDVLVIDAGGLMDAAVLGDQSAERAAAAGIAGCVVNGAVRDVDSLAAGPLAVWSRGRTPRAALHRLETVEVNGSVSLGAVAVRAGDLVLGDGNGVAVIPVDLVEAVVDLCERIERRHMPSPPRNQVKGVPNAVGEDCR